MFKYIFLKLDQINNVYSCLILATNKPKKHRLCECFIEPLQSKLFRALL